MIVRFLEITRRQRDEEEDKESESGVVGSRKKKKSVTSMKTRLEGVTMDLERCGLCYYVPAPLPSSSYQEGERQVLSSRGRVNIHLHI